VGTYGNVTLHIGGEILHLSAYI